MIGKEYTRTKVFSPSFVVRFSRSSFCPHPARCFVASVRARRPEPRRIGAYNKPVRGTVEFRAAETIAHVPVEQWPTADGRGECKDKRRACSPPNRMPEMLYWPLFFFQLCISANLFINCARHSFDPLFSSAEYSAITSAGGELATRQWLHSKCAPIVLASDPIFAFNCPAFGALGSDKLIISTYECEKSPQR